MSDLGLTELLLPVHRYIIIQTRLFGTPTNSLIPEHVVVPTNTRTYCCVFPYDIIGLYNSTTAAVRSFLGTYVLLYFLVRFITGSTLKCKNVGTQQSGIWRNGKEISENRVVRGGVVPEERIMEAYVGESQQHQHSSTAAAQQQRVSNTTTGRDKRKKCPRCRDRSSSSSTMVKIDGMSIRGREAARGGTNRNLIYIH